MIIIWGTSTTWQIIEGNPVTIPWTANRNNWAAIVLGAIGGSAGQILKSVYDPTNNALRLKDVGAPSGSAGDGNMDAQQILRRVYDSSTRSLRVVQV